MKRISKLSAIFLILCLPILYSCSKNNNNSPTNPTTEGNNQTTYTANGVAKDFQGTYKFYSIDGQTADITISDTGISGLKISNDTASIINFDSSTIYSSNRSGDTDASIPNYKYYLIYGDEFKGSISFPNDSTSIGYIRLRKSLSTYSIYINGIFERTQNAQRTLGTDSELIATWKGSYTDGSQLTVTIDKDFVSYTADNKTYKIPSIYFINQNDGSYNTQTPYLKNSIIVKNANNKIQFSYKHFEIAHSPSVLNGQVTGDLQYSLTSFGLPNLDSIEFSK
ncbi:hypothetical protein BFL38_06140 [Brachyspira hampsonii]|uniref:Lipoprotein n=1 Tax=Brachyspira hampsonii TaxID=1287055 RepID=A0A1E5NE20_9SPIR|nr:hypothetical protein [Brachyspira hampsonii]OEJ14406.1 hypothetical protein BFL38_06140 [Brachyspira hampsonii]